MHYRELHAEIASLIAPPLPQAPCGSLDPWLDLTGLLLRGGRGRKEGGEEWYSQREERGGDPLLSNTCGHCLRPGINRC